MRPRVVQEIFICFSAHHAAHEALSSCLTPLSSSTEQGRCKGQTCVHFVLLLPTPPFFSLQQHQHFATSSTHSNAVNITFQRLFQQHSLCQTHIHRGLRHHVRLQQNDHYHIEPQSKPTRTSRGAPEHDSARTLPLCRYTRQMAPLPHPRLRLQHALPRHPPKQPHNLHPLHKPPHPKPRHRRHLHPLQHPHRLHPRRQKHPSRRRKPHRTDQRPLLLALPPRYPPLHKSAYQRRPKPRPRQTPSGHHSTGAREVVEEDVCERHVGRREAHAGEL